MNYHGRGTKADSTATVNSATPASVLAANPARTNAMIFNQGPATVYIGGSDLAAGQGIALASNTGYEDTTSWDAWFAYVNSGSATLSIVETSV